MIDIIVITGQTATGKTALALEYAKKYNGELINADSRQIYKYLTIITGKDITPGAKFQHVDIISDFDLGYYLIDNTALWLYDAVDPDSTFSSYDFQKLAVASIDTIHKKGKIPIIVGGSYFYIKHLLYGFETQSSPPDWNLRNRLNSYSTAKLQQELQLISSDIFEKMNHSDQNNPRRLIRRLEIELFKKNKHNMSSSPIAKRQSNLFVKQFIGLKYIDNDALLGAIEKRVHKRIEQGAIEEVQKLLSMGYREIDPGLNSIGYLQLIKYLKGIKTKEETISEWISKELQYAKRQYTFMKKDMNITWELIQ